MTQTKFDSETVYTVIIYGVEQSCYVVEEFPDSEYVRVQLFDGDTRSVRADQLNRAEG